MITDLPLDIQFSNSNASERGTGGAEPDARKNFTQAAVC